jgi:hypothetical protein
MQQKVTPQVGDRVIIPYANNQEGIVIAIPPDASPQEEVCLVAFPDGQIRYPALNDVIVAYRPYYRYVCRNLFGLGDLVERPLGAKAIVTRLPEDGGYTYSLFDLDSGYVVSDEENNLTLISAAGHPVAAPLTPPAP